MRAYITGFAVVCLCGLASAQDKPAPPNAEAVAAIKAIGGNVMPLAQNDGRLDVTLHLSDKEVKDDALAQVEKLSPVAWLNLANTEITDAGLAHLANLKTLEKLHLEKTGIGDAGLEHLKGLENLEYLNVYSTKVTDAGLSQLHGLKKLKRLYVWQSGVTQAGIDALKQALPECKVTAEVKLTPVEPPKEEKK
jgi:hypothetical protein